MFTQLPPPTCLAIDFDGCLARFTDDKAGLFQIFTSRRVPKMTVQRAYRQARQNDGFTYVKFYQAVCRLTAKKFPHSELKREFNRWLKQSLKIYPDVKPALARCRKNKIPVIIVTYGDPTFQRLKIRQLGLKPNRVMILKSENRKGQALKKLLRQFGPPILFIDDKAAELDAVFRPGLNRRQIQTRQLRRPDRSARQPAATFKHQIIRSLRSIFV